MKISTIGLVVVLAVSIGTATATLSQAEYRFGPWVYWAPYYYPPEEMMQCLGFKPEDFAPRYQAPNPMAPPDCPPPPPLLGRIASREKMKQQLNGPVVDVPTRVPVRRPQRVLRSTGGPRTSPPTTIQERPQVSVPEPPGQRKYQFGQEEPQPVPGVPGSQDSR